MSLEIALQENTSVMKELIATLQASSKAQVKADTAKKPASTAPSQPVETSTSIDFDTLKKVFLQLAGKDRPSAEAVLKEFKVAKLTELKAEQYAAAHAQIAAVLEGGAK